MVFLESPFCINLPVTGAIAVLAPYEREAARLLTVRAFPRRQVSSGPGATVSRPPSNAT